MVVRLLHLRTGIGQQIVRIADHCKLAGMSLIRPSERQLSEEAAPAQRYAGIPHISFDLLASLVGCDASYVVMPTMPSSSRNSGNNS